MNKNCKYSREQLMNTINQVSFAVDDIKLYLDTHPDDEKALEFFKEKLIRFSFCAVIPHDYYLLMCGTPTES